MIWVVFASPLKKAESDVFGKASILPRLKTNRAPLELQVYAAPSIQQ